MTAKKRAKGEQSAKGEKSAKSGKAKSGRRRRDGSEPAQGERRDGGGGAHFAVDRVEGRVAVLVDDEGRTHDVALDAVTVRLREGMVLRVADGADGRPDWSSAVVDEAERDRRLRDVEARAARLARRDDGGDVAL